MTLPMPQGSSNQTFSPLISSFFLSFFIFVFIFLVCFLVLTPSAFLLLLPFQELLLEDLVKKYSAKLSEASNEEIVIEYDRLAEVIHEEPRLAFLEGK